MSDAVLQYDESTGAFDIVLEGGEIRQSTGLVSAVIVSLFSDRRAANDDPLPDNTNDRRGCWTDSYTDSPIGSRLWLVSREKMVAGLADRIEGYAREALQWLIDDGEVQAVQLQAERLTSDTIGLQVACVVDQFDEELEGLASGRVVIDGLDVIVLLRLFPRLGDVHFPEFEYEG